MLVLYVRTSRVCAFFVPGYASGGEGCEESGPAVGHDGRYTARRGRRGLICLASKYSSCTTPVWETGWQLTVPLFREQWLVG